VSASLPALLRTALMQGESVSELAADYNLTNDELEQAVLSERAA